MFPIALDLTKINIKLVGKGEALQRRHKQLLEYGATNISSLRGDEVDEAIQHLDATGLLRFTRNDEKIVMVCGLSHEVSEKIADAARAAGKLVNVEDMNDLCDFYFTANVKRGDLVIAVSTGGASPTLSRRIRDYIAQKFGAEWENRVVEIADFRRKLKDDGKNMPEVLAESEKFLTVKGWLK